MLSSLQHPPINKSSSEASFISEVFFPSISLSSVYSYNNDSDSKKNGMLTSYVE